MSDFQETVTFQYSISGNVSAAAGTVPIPVPFPCELVKVDLAVGTAPTGAALIVDINKNGTTIFSSQSDPDNRPTIAATKTSASVSVSPALAAGTNYIYTPYPTSAPLATFAAGDKITIDVDQVGSSVAGAALGVVLTVVKK